MKGFLAEHLLKLFARKSYGKNAQQIIDLCALVHEAQSTWSKIEVKEFQSESTINSQVWGKLNAIALDKRLLEHINNLPSSYSALYALTCLTDQHLSDGFGFGIIHPGASSRQIQAWAQEWQIRSSTNLKVRTIYLASEIELDDSECKKILEKLNEYASAEKVLLLEGLGNSRHYQQKQQKIIEASRKLSAIETDIEHFMYLGGGEFIKHYSLEKIDSLMEGDFNSFARALLRISRSRKEMMSNHGIVYCYKIALEYFRADSRSQRFNYKQRLKHVRLKYPELAYIVNLILEKYFSSETESLIRVGSRW